MTRALCWIVGALLVSLACTDVRRASLGSAQPSTPDAGDADGAGDENTDESAMPDASPRDGAPRDGDDDDMPPGIDAGNADAGTDAGPVDAGEMHEEDGDDDDS